VPVFPEDQLSPDADVLYDLTGVRVQADTELFSRFGVIPGDGGFYSVIDLTGDGIVFEGG
jgi:hypothetical protein